MSSGRIVRLAFGKQCADEHEHEHEIRGTKKTESFNHSHARSSDPSLVENVNTRTVSAAFWTFSQSPLYPRIVR